MISSNIGTTETLLIIIFFFVFRFVMCEGPTGFEKKNESSKSLQQIQSAWDNLRLKMPLIF